MKKFQRKNSSFPFWILALLVVLLDQTSKCWVAHSVNSPISLIPNFISLVRVYNDGAAWNLFSGQQTFLIILACFILAGGLIFRRQLGVHRLGAQISLALIAGGIVGNLIDRIHLGAVIDFLDVNLFIYHWPAFNIADFAICIGAIFYCFQSISPPKG